MVIRQDGGLPVLVPLHPFMASSRPTVFSASAAPDLRTEGTKIFFGVCRQPLARTCLHCGTSKQRLNIRSAPVRKPCGCATLLSLSRCYSALKSNDRRDWPTLKSRPQGHVPEQLTIVVSAQALANPVRMDRALRAWQTRAQPIPRLRSRAPGNNLRTNLSVDLIPGFGSRKDKFQRSTSTGVCEWVNTCWVSLPSNRRLIPLRP